MERINDINLVRYREGWTSVLLPISEYPYNVHHWSNAVKWCHEHESTGYYFIFSEDFTFPIQKMQLYFN